MLNRRREALWEYLRGAMWVLPAVAVLVAMGLGAGLSRVNVAEGSPLHKLVFQGTADDARTLLIGIAGTMITVIVLMLGLTVVALQLSSTQYSPRILRNFLRDRHNQLVLSVFVATFAYATAGLYTVGISAGERTAQFPRPAVTGAIVMLFLSLGALVYEIHHISHSMQIDEIMRQIDRGTRAVIRDEISGGRQAPPPVPETAVAIPATRSGYVQTIHSEPAVALAVEHGLCLRICKRVGEHVVAGVPLAWAWTDPGPGPADGVGVDVERLTRAVSDTVRIGFERTLEQDAAFGVRQLVDIASKALSPAVNDPYTAVQAVDHLAVIVASLARRPLGAIVVAAGRSGSVTVPGLDFADYLDLACAQIRRYGAPEPIVAIAQIDLLRTAANAVRVDAAVRHGAIGRQLDLILADSQRRVEQPADLEPVQAAAALLRAELMVRTGRSNAVPPPRQPPRDRRPHRPDSSSSPDDAT